MPFTNPPTLRWTLAASSWLGPPASFDPTGSRRNENTVLASYILWAYPVGVVFVGDQKAKSPRGKPMVVTETTVELDRDEIAERLEAASRDAIGVSASELLRGWRDRTLDDPGAVADIIALAALLPDDDPLRK
jgi:hypothetical protein